MVEDFRMDMNFRRQETGGRRQETNYISFKLEL